MASYAPRSTRQQQQQGGNYFDADDSDIVADQLAKQLDYSNSLLVQVQTLETEQLNLRREYLISQENNKKFSQENERMRQELAEFRRKVSLSQELAETLTKQSKDSRSELHKYKLDAESAIRDSASCKVLLEKITSEKAILQRDFLNFKASSQANNDENADIIQDYMSQLDIIKRLNDSLSKEVVESRNKISTLESEKISMHQNFKSLSLTVEDLSNRLNSELKLHDADGKRLKDVSVSFDKLLLQYNEMDISHQNACDKVAMYKATNDETTQALSSLEEKLNVEKGRSLELEEINSNLGEEITRLKKDLSLSKDDSRRLTEKLQSNFDNFAKLIQNTKDEYENALNETKKTSLSTISEYQRRIVAIEESQRQCEDKYFIAQEELQELHELMQQLQTDHTANQKDLISKKTSLEVQLFNANEKLSQCEAAVDKIEKASRSQQVAFESTISSTKADHTAKIDKYIQILSYIQTEFKKFKDRSMSNKLHVRECFNQIEQLKGKYMQSYDKLRFECTSYRSQIEKVIHQFVENRNTIIAEAKLHADKLYQVEVLYEAELSKNADLEELSSQLQRRVSNLESSLIQNDYIVKDQTHKCQSIVEKHTHEKSHLDNKITKLQQALENITIQNKNLQTTQISAQNTIADLSAKQNAERLEFESRLSAISLQLRHLSDENSDILREKQELEENFHQLRSQYIAKSEELNSESNLANELKQDFFDLRSNHEQTLVALKSSNMHLNNQVKQSHEILKVMQVQKAELLQENQYLRADLETCMRTMRNNHDDGDDN